jgi:hypothetical protein
MPRFPPEGELFGSPAGYEYTQLLALAVDVDSARA